MISQLSSKMFSLIPDSSSSDDVMSLDPDTEQEFDVDEFINSCTSSSSSSSQDHSREFFWTPPSGDVSTNCYQDSTHQDLDEYPASNLLDEDSYEDSAVPVYGFPSHSVNPGSGLPCTSHDLILDSVLSFCTELLSPIQTGVVCSDLKTDRAVWSRTCLSANVLTDCQTAYLAVYPVVAISLVADIITLLMYVNCCICLYFYY